MSAPEEKVVVVDGGESRELSVGGTPGAAQEVVSAGESRELSEGGMPAAVQEVVDVGERRELSVGGTPAAAEEMVSVGERRKLFVGGIPVAVQEAELRGYFARFGAVRSVVVMRDRETGRGRGFGFVEFEDEEAAAKVLGEGERPRHLICGRLVDVKRARARPARYYGEQQQLEQGTPEPTKNLAEDNHNSVDYVSKKIFIGGLRDNITEKEARTYFEAFGTVTDVVVIYDSMTGRSRGFGFVTFDSEEAVRKVMQKTFHDLNGANVEAKIAIPKDAQYYSNGRGRGPRPFGGRDPVPYDGTSYQPHIDPHGFYNGYMPEPVPAPMYYPGLFYGMGGYPYANVYPNQGVMANAPNMAPRHPAPVYNAYAPMYQGYGFGYGAGYPPAATPVQYGVNGAGGYTNDQAYMDTQEVDSTATMLEYMKLGPQ